MRLWKSDATRGGWMHSAPDVVVRTHSDAGGAGGGLAGTAGFEAGFAGAADGDGAAVLGEIRPAATMATRSTSIRYLGIPTNSIRSFTRIAGPNFSLYFARSGVVASGGSTWTVHSGWSERKRSAISWIRSSWYPWTEARNATVTMRSRPRTRARHIKFVRRAGETRWRRRPFPRRMRFLAASDADEASRGQRQTLLEAASWSAEPTFEGRPAWRFRDLVLATIDGSHLHRDHLDRDLERAFGEPADLVVYLSKHKSESERPSLTVHPIGNPATAEFGGRPETLVPSAPRWMTAALRALKRAAAPLAYAITFEATHHGPYLTAPTFYIEQGSTAREWNDVAASRTIARVLLDLTPVDAPIAVGFGGGHYVPRHTDLALERRIAFGHLLPAYALERAPPAIVDQAIERTRGATIAYLHRKTIGKEAVRSLEERLDSFSVRVVREADLPIARGDETS